MARACVIALAWASRPSLSHRANAQDAASTCAPAIGRLVSLQGERGRPARRRQSWTPGAAPRHLDLRRRPAAHWAH